jgi:hypothetical protein
MSGSARMAVNSVASSALHTTHMTVRKLLGIMARVLLLAVACCCVRHAIACPLALASGQKPDADAAIQLACVAEQLSQSVAATALQLHMRMVATGATPAVAASPPGVRILTTTPVSLGDTTTGSGLTSLGRSVNGRGSSSSQPSVVMQGQAPAKVMEAPAAASLPQPASSGPQQVTVALPVTPPSAAPAATGGAISVSTSTPVHVSVPVTVTTPQATSVITGSSGSQPGGALALAALAGAALKPRVVVVPMLLG